MFNCAQFGTKAILVHIFFTQDHNIADIKELEALVCSAGLSVLDLITCSRKEPNSKYFIGEGKADEIAEQVKISGASIVIFNHALSPVQERNLEHLCQCRVIDRTGLILSIFAQRARTHEGKLQVELAQLRYIATRLVRGWNHLERQKGGIGLLSGPGETQLETDRRLLRNRMKTIKLRLAKVEKRREQGRYARACVPTILLVGYTNAGKSTLFNSMTKASVDVADQLFTTLDPTLKRLNIPTIGNIILADTVGFIQHLPHQLVASFKSTLQETQQATLLLHIVDAADHCLNVKINAVKKVLVEINADNISTLLVMNKIDQLDKIIPRIDRNTNNEPICVWLSAQKVNGITLLIEALSELLGRKHQIISYHLRLPPQASRLRSRFYQLQAIEKEWIEQDGSIRLVVKLPIIHWYRLCKQEVTLLEYLI